MVEEKSKVEQKIEIDDKDVLAIFNSGPDMTTSTDWRTRVEQPRRATNAQQFKRKNLLEDKIRSRTKSEVMENLTLLDLGMKNGP